MAGASIEVQGLDAIFAQLRAIGPDLRETLRPVIEEALEIVRGRMAEYPAPPASSRYQRTGALGASWQILPDGSGEVLGVVRSSNVPYNRYVQSEEEQAYMHRGRWQTDEQVAAEKEPEVAAILESFLETLL